MVSRSALISMKLRIYIPILLILAGEGVSAFAGNKGQPAANDISIAGTVNPPEEIRQKLQLPSTLAFELKVKMQAVPVSQNSQLSRASGNYSVLIKDPETQKVLLDTSTTYAAEFPVEPTAALSQANQAVVAAIGAMLGGTNILQLTGTNIHLNKVGVEVRAKENVPGKSSTQNLLQNAVVAKGEDYLKAETGLLDGGEDVATLLRQNVSDTNIVVRSIARNILGMKCGIMPENQNALKILENTSRHFKPTVTGYPPPSITSGNLRVSIGPRVAEFLALRLLKETVSDRRQALGIIQYLVDVKDPVAFDLLARFSQETKDEILKKQAIEVLQKAAPYSGVSEVTKAVSVPILNEDPKHEFIQPLVMEQLKPDRQKSVGKSVQPVSSVEGGLTDVIRISQSPILAATEHEGFYFYATGGARDQDGNLVSWLSGYAIQRNRREIFTWSIW